ncbi:MAG: diadenylate cyclase CdaA [Polyangiaceae bacterium]|nr:diadenylate cyclase CdaA [Polyangiaceae bacterium]
MLHGLRHWFALRLQSPLRLAIDVVDVLFVAYVVYRALLVLRGTRAMQVGTGLGVIFIVYVVAQWLGLDTLVTLLSTLSTSITIIVVVIFQNDIRRGLMRVGAPAFFGGIARQQETRVIEEVVAAATELARHRIGALICFEQEANLDEFVVAQGTTLDAAVQRELLVSLFIPESLNKLHDGAVVIRHLRVAKGGVFFPMPDTKVVDKSLGSRHRAALGITEETDAVVVVVSEERGTISFCFNGNIVPNLDGGSLKQALLGLFGQHARAKKKAPAKKRRGLRTRLFRVSVPQNTPVAGSPALQGGRASVPGAPARESDGRPSSPSSPSPPSPDFGAMARSSAKPQVEESVPPRATDSARSMPSSAVETPIPMPPSAPPPVREGGGSES